MSRVASFYDKTVAEVYERYQKRLISSNAVDFDDILMLTVEVFERFPEALAHWQHTFRYVLVDEYQDTNRAQYRLLQLLAAEHGNVFAVGDPDQCLVLGTLVSMADGTVRPIQHVSEGDAVLTCLGSGKFGPGRVVNVHRSRRRTGIAITTISGRQIVSTPEHTHFAGFKTGWTPQLHMTYLMWKRGTGFRVGTSRTYTDARTGALSRAVASDECRARGRHLDRVDARDRRGGAKPPRQAFRRTTASRWAVRHQTRRSKQQQPRRRSVADRLRLRAGRH